MFSVHCIVLLCWCTEARGAARANFIQCIGQTCHPTSLRVIPGLLYLLHPEYYDLKLIGFGSGCLSRLETGIGCS